MFLIFGMFSANAQQKATKPVVNKVIIYGSDECHHCTDTKAFLTQNNISYIYLLKDQLKILDERKLGLSKIYENNEVNIYKMLK